MGTLGERGTGRWRSLLELALGGLQRAYGDPCVVLPHTRRWDGAQARSEGDNPRYGLITLLGLARASSLTSSATELARVVRSRLMQVRGRWSPTLGDLGLGLWARALDGADDDSVTADGALAVLRASSERCDSVELAWLLLGADHAVVAGMTAQSAAALADEAKTRLLAVYNPDSALFYRHPRRGVVRGISRRVPCFANQIYPVMALSVHARRTGCSPSREVVRCVADRLCSLQGPMGQWWWLYDAAEGGVVDGYPVFSVHQDGMAPMALMEAARVVGRSFNDEIERGLNWIFGENELGRTMVVADEGLILRDIHRRGVGRARRAVRAALWCCGRRGRAGKTDGCFVINPECRPYHLGWILYAAASMLEQTTAARESARPWISETHAGS